MRLVHEGRARTRAIQRSPRTKAATASRAKLPNEGYAVLRPLIQRIHGYRVRAAVLSI